MNFNDRKLTTTVLFFILVRDIEQIVTLFAIVSKAKKKLKNLK